MERDTYHDYVTGLETVMDPSAFSRVRRALAIRSGFFNVLNARLEDVQSFNQDVHKMRVTFDSKGWTGR